MNSLHRRRFGLHSCFPRRPLLLRNRSFYDDGWLKAMPAGAKLVNWVKESGELRRCAAVRYVAHALDPPRSEVHEALTPTVGTLDPLPHSASV